MIVQLDTLTDTLVFKVELLPEVKAGGYLVCVCEQKLHV